PPPSRPAGIALARVVGARGPERRRVLDGVSLRLAPGARAVVTGPSGGGKTTLAHLPIRVLERQGGAATIGPHDLRDHRQDDVRSAVLLSAQEPHVFSTTIRENLPVVRPGGGGA